MLAEVQTLNQSIVNPFELLQKGEVTEDELSYLSPVFWCQLANLHIIHPIKGRVPFILYPHQVRFLADQSQRRLVVKARQIGLSQVCALEALHTALFYPGSTILLVSRKEDLAANLLKYVKDILPSVPAHQHPRIIVNNNLEISWENGSRIKSETASESTGRGFAATKLIMDEEAWMQYALEIYQSALPMTSLGGSITVLSTPNGRTGVGEHFYELWSGEAGKLYSKHRIPWYRANIYNPTGYAVLDPRESKLIGMGGKWYKENRPAFTERQFATEYDCDFVLSGITIFKDEFIERMPVGWKGFQDPVPGHRYMKAWDIGRRADPLIGWVADITDFDEKAKKPLQIVHYVKREKLPYPDQVELIHHIHDDYPGWTYIESNGAGDAVVDMVDRRNVVGYHMTMTKKKQAIDAFMYMQEHQLFKCGVEELLSECRKYTEDDRDIVQDHVMAAAILSRQLVTPGPRGGWIIGKQVSK